MNRPTREQIEAAREWLCDDTLASIAERNPVTAHHIRTPLAATAEPTEEELAEDTRQQRSEDLARFEGDRMRGLDGAPRAGRE